MKIGKTKRLLVIRSAQKAASRAADVARMKAGVSPARIQEENSAFKGLFNRCKTIPNLAEALNR
ncbi:MAG: hypothetical protein RL514_4572 [Verrucomicrobiota bacterium]|jgi:hypothetical protein